MGIIRKGILGGFSKKTGPLVGAIYNNQHVIRSLPLKSAKEPTQAQLDQRFKFGLVSAFLSPISELIHAGFADGPKKRKQGQMHRAIAYHLAHAITGNSPDYRLDYTHLCFSKGKLALPDDVALEAVPRSIEFSWLDDGIENAFKAPDDRLTLLVYNPAKAHFTFQIDAGERSDQFYRLQLPEVYQGDRVYGYLSFNSTKIKHLVSPSIFVGQTMVL